MIMAGDPGQIVIAGAGPAGLTLAYLLARRGVGVTVLETHHDFARVFRGEGLQRSGIDAFRQMGLGEQSWPCSSCRRTKGASS
jgi:2-polyprenyl-6-methoxyphenol hydroxylase-like FAD-dependent oxidoreductase